MKRRVMYSLVLLVALSWLGLGSHSLAQQTQSGLTLPPGGDNQHSITTQYMGMVAVTIEYNSPDVTGPSGEDRKGKIWGQLVPYGLANLGFGNGKPGPWRVGANENTTLAVSHDVEVEGKPLPAGKYGLHMIAGPEEWTIIFSKNATAWGSFFYEESEDALRVTVKPEKTEFREWLNFDFLDRQLDSCLVALHWENLRVPFRIRVPDMVGLYVKTLRRELTGAPGFYDANWNAAAQFLLQRDKEGKYLGQALEWAEAAVSAPFVGREDFTNLQTKAQVLERMGKTADFQATLQKALDHPTATALQIHQYGRQLLTQGKTQVALQVFEHNAKRFAGGWPTQIGLARAYSATGELNKALDAAKKALAQAPDDLNRNNIQNMIKNLEQGKTI